MKYIEKSVYTRVETKRKGNSYYHCKHDLRGRDVVEYFVLAKAESNTALMTKWDNYTDIIFTLEESNAPVQLNVISANKTQSSVFTENTRDPSIPLNFSKPWSNADVHWFKRIKISI